MRRIPSLWISIAFIAGIIFAYVFSAGMKFWLYSIVFAGFFASLEILFLKRWLRYQRVREKLPFAISFLLIFFIFGGMRYAAVTQPPKPSDVAFHNQSGRIEINGIICDDPQHKENSVQLVVCADSIVINGENHLPTKGKVLVRLQPGSWQYGDRVIAHGSLTEPPEDENFSYRFYLSTRGVHSLMEYPYLQLVQSDEGNRLMQGIVHFRQRAYQTINDFLPQPEAGLLSGVLLGLENDIPFDLEKAFQDTGTAHIIAISGFNMTLLAGLILSLFRRNLPFWWSGVLAILTIAIYTLLVGASPPVVRAALMSSLAMGARLIGRRQEGVYTLTLTVAVLCAFNPLFLGDTGFQLSAMATLGLVLYAERMSSWFENFVSRWMSDSLVKKIKGPVGDYFLFTIAAQITTLPVIVFQFEQIPISSLISNPLILPVQPLVMIIGGIAVITGLLIPPLGQLVAYLAWLPLTYTIHMVQLIGNLPDIGINTGKVSLIGILVFYGLLFLLTLPTHILPKVTINQKQLLAGLSLLTVTTLIWNMVLTRTTGYLHIVIFNDPNQGVVMIQTPGGKRILINGGSSANVVSATLNRYLPVLDRQIDIAIFSETQKKMNQAFPMLISRYSPDLFLWASPDPGHSVSNHIAELLMEEEINSQIWEKASVVDMGDGVNIIHIDSGKENATLQLTYGNLRLFLVGDNEPQNLQNLTLAGSIVVLPPGDANVEKWQDFQILTTIHHNAYQKNGLSTWQHGWIQLWSDGEKLWIRSDK